jgi:hypothetical protein
MPHAVCRAAAYLPRLLIGWPRRLAHFGLAGLAAALFLSGCGGGSAPRFDTPYQAVFMANGQVFFGKLSGFGTDHPRLDDVFYVQQQVNPETKQATGVLIRRGREWHGPSYMVLNARSILLVEPVGPDSKVAQLIAEAQKQAGK